MTPTGLILHRHDHTGNEVARLLGLADSFPLEEAVRRDQATAVFIASRNDSFFAASSLRALIRLLPIFGSFAQNGIEPQRASANLALALGEPDPVDFNLRHFLIRLSEQRQHQFDANLVACMVGVDAVRDPDVLARLAVGREHRIPQIDEM